MFNWNVTFNFYRRLVSKLPPLSSNWPLRRLLPSHDIKGVVPGGGESMMAMPRQDRRAGVSKGATEARWEPKSTMSSNWKKNGKLSLLSCIFLHLNYSISKRKLAIKFLVYIPKIDMMLPCYLKNIANVTLLPIIGNMLPCYLKFMPCYLVTWNV